MSKSTPLSARRLAALLALWITVSAAALLAPGCYGRECEGSFEAVGGEGFGTMVDENTWQSSPPEGRWLPFPGQRFYAFDVPALGGRTPSVVIPYLSATPEPLSADPKKRGDFTIGAGNLALLSSAGPNHIDIRNDTCSSYFLRLVVTVPAASPSSDGGLIDGSTDEAGTDARALDASDNDGSP